jgi:hypothetical protein
MERADYPRCRTCRHWTLVPASGDGSWPCSKVVIPDVDEDAAEAMLAFVNGSAQLWVTAAFGCIQHEERDDGTTHDEG